MDAGERLMPTDVYAGQVQIFDVHLTMQHRLKVVWFQINY